MAVSRRNEGSDLAARVIAAIPAIAFAIFIVVEGGTVFAVGIALLGVMACAELFRMMRGPGPPVVAGYLVVIALVFAARYGDRDQVLLLIVISVPVVFFFTLLRPEFENASWAMAVVFLGVIWIGMAGAPPEVVGQAPPRGGAGLATPVRNLP